LLLQRRLHLLLPLLPLLLWLLSRLLLLLLLLLLRLAAWRLENLGWPSLPYIRLLMLPLGLGCGIGHSTRGRGMRQPVIFGSPRSGGCVASWTRSHLGLRRRRRRRRIPRDCRLFMKQSLPDARMRLGCRSC
jgi:hypothetical protein